MKTDYKKSEFYAIGLVPFFTGKKMLRCREFLEKKYLHEKL